MRILITGAGGFIGSHLVDKCVADGHDVLALDIKYRDHWLKSNREPYSQLSNVDIIKGVPQISFDLCYHLAAESRIQPSFNDPAQYVKTNVLGTMNVLEACRRNKARMVYAGSSTADDDTALNVYATSKHQGEQLCRTWAKCFGVSTAVARFYNVYGPRQIEDGPYATVLGIFEKQYREGKPLTVTGDGSQRRDFTHVEDIVEGLVAIASRGSQYGYSYSLGTQTNHSILEVARMFGRDIEFIPRPSGESDITQADTRGGEELRWRAKRDLQSYVNSFIANHEAYEVTDNRGESMADSF